MGLDITISGSYRKFPEEVGMAIDEFEQFGSRVLSPRSAHILASVDGFVSLKKDPIERIDRVSASRLPEAFQLVENGHLQAIQQSDALWLVMPTGYLGVSGSLEVGWALAHKVPVYARMSEWLATSEPMVRAYVAPKASIAHLIAGFEKGERSVHDPIVGRGLVETAARKLYGSEYTTSVAVGPLLIDNQDDKSNPEVLLVETYKWGGRLSIPGERLQRGERIESGLHRIVAEQTGLQGEQKGVVCAFDELPSSGYWQPNTNRLFVDFAVAVDLKGRVELDHRASRAVVMPLDEILTLPDSQIEPNAKKAFAELKARYAA